MSKITIKASGKAELCGRNFAGKSWTEGFRKLGCSEVIIETPKDTILLDWNLPHTRYGNVDDDKKFQEYLAQRKQEGWIFHASWGYGYFVLTAPSPDKESNE